MNVFSFEIFSSENFPYKCKIQTPFVMGSFYQECFHYKVPSPKRQQLTEIDTLQRFLITLYTHLIFLLHNSSFFLLLASYNVFMMLFTPALCSQSLFPHDTDHLLSDCSERLLFKYC